jgi:uncharacterized protein
MQRPAPGARSSSPAATLPELAAALVAALGGESAVEVRETHLSYVFLTASRAYKLKKAVVLPFADYGTVARRREFCGAEVRLNRRLAPDIYIAVRAVVAEGGGVVLGDANASGAVDFVVEMNRFDEGDTLAARIASGEARAADVEAVAETLARFHAGLPPVLPAGGPLTTLRAEFAETFRTLHELVPEDAAHHVAAAERFTWSFLARRGGEIAARARAGHVREGHGDLRAEHVVLGRGVQVVDCVEFDPALRTVDNGADLAFLVMDLERAGRADLAATFVRAYEESGGDPGSDALIAFHAAQRAWVRAKVSLLQHDGAAAGELLRLGRRFAWRARGPLVLAVCGLSGSGKTTLARQLAEPSGLAVFSSDPVRKRLAGLAPGETGPPELYDDEFNRRTYAELGRLARGEIENARSAIVDATFRSARDRRAFLDALGTARLFFVECAAPLDTLVERTAARPSGASDATPEVVRSQTFDWLAEAQPERHLILRTERPAPALVRDVEAWLDERL